MGRSCSWGVHRGGIVVQGRSGGNTLGGGGVGGLTTLGSGAAVGPVCYVDSGPVLDVVVGATVGPVVPWQNISRRWAIARSWSSVVAFGAPLIALVRARKLWMMWSSVVSVPLNYPNSI